MKRLASILSLLLVLALCTATVSAAPLSEPISASGSEAVSASVYEEITRSTGELDVEQVGSINLGLALMYRAYFKTDHGTVLPDYFAGFYTDSNGFTVMGLTEITDEILAEIRTAFYSYRSGTGEAGDIAYMDRWFPTIRYQLMEYSYNQLAELENAIDDALKENGEENFRAIADLEINQVLLFCETETARECALELAGAELDMLQTRPFTAFESWVAERSAPAQNVSAGGLDMEQLQDVYSHFMTVYWAQHRTGHGAEFPDYFGGFYADADGFTVMGLTEITDEILAEIRTVFYSYRSRAGEEADVAYMDQWFPMLRYQLVEYSYKQLAELEETIDDVLKENGEENFRVIAELKTNQVRLFCETETARECALELAGEDLDMLQICPFIELESWWASSPFSTQTTETEETPAEPTPKTAGKKRDGQDAGLRANGAMRSSCICAR